MKHGLVGLKASKLVEATTLSFDRQSDFFCTTTLDVCFIYSESQFESNKAATDIVVDCWNISALMKAFFPGNLRAYNTKTYQIG